MLTSLANTVASRAVTMSDYSLSTGKAGVAIFLYHYSDLYHDAKSKKIADNIMHDISLNASSVGNLDFLHGLLGIGWAFEYIVENGFVKNNCDDILKELDDTLTKFKRHRDPFYYSSEDFFGYGLYFIKRYKSNMTFRPLQLTVKHNILLFLLDECQDCIRYKVKESLEFRVLDFPILLSISYFALECFYLRLNHEKVSRLLISVMDCIQMSVYKSYTDLENQELSYIAEKILEVVPSSVYKNLPRLILSMRRSKVNDKRLDRTDRIESTIRSSFYRTIFDVMPSTIHDARVIRRNPTRKLSLKDIEFAIENLSECGLKSGLSGLGLSVIRNMLDKSTLR